MHDAKGLPLWHTLYRRMGRSKESGVLEHMLRDLRMPIRAIAGRTPGPGAAILDWPQSPAKPRERRR